MQRMIVYVHGSKRVGKTVLAQELVQRALAAGIVAETASIVGVMRQHIKDMFSLTDEHVHGDLKETPLPECSGHSARELMDDFVTWHFQRDPSRMCFIRGCMADIERRDDVGLFCIQDVIHAHEPPCIREAAARMGAAAVGVHVSRPGHTDTYGVNMPPEQFDITVANTGTLEEYRRKAARLFESVVRQCV